MLDADALDDAAALLAELREAGLTLATAESCTGGLIAAALTAIPRSSATLLCGFVTYSNESKTALLGVPAAMIAAHGAVSEPVARAMAEGALARSQAALAVSITGIAGPGGATPGKPVGLVWFALARKDRPTLTRRAVFSGLDRAGVRAASVETALGLLHDALA